MKIIRKDTVRTYRYVTEIYPYVAEETPESEIGWQMSLSVSVHPDTNAPSMRGLGQFSYSRQEVEKLRAALDAALVEMDTIEAMQLKEQAAKQSK